MLIRNLTCAVRNGNEMISSYLNANDKSGRKDNTLNYSELKEAPCRCMQQA